VRYCVCCAYIEKLVENRHLYKKKEDNVPHIDECYADVANGLFEIAKECDNDSSDKEFRKQMEEKREVRV